MPNNLPTDFKDVEDATIVGVDSRGHSLTHYVLAERLMQVEYHTVAQELREGVSDTLIYMLEGGVRGYHKYTGGELWTEWRDGAEAVWYELALTGRLPWEPLDEDPFLAEAQTEAV